MSGTTISGGYFSPVTLSNGATQNPATVTSNGTILAAGIALLGETGTAWTVTNYGAIQGTGADGVGVELLAGGDVSNAAAGTITGTANGVYLQGATGTVTNAGTITGTGSIGAGVQLISGGLVINQAGGTIDGAFYGVVSSNAATVINYGQIGVAGANGIGLASGQVTNVAGATITGTGGGVRIFGGGTVVDAGAISGGTDAVYFHAGFANRMVVDPGAVLNGTVDGGNTIGAASVSTLELAFAFAVGTLSGLGAHYINFAQVTIDSGANWLLSGSNTVAAGVTLSNAGGLTLADTFVNAGSIDAGGGLQLADGVGFSNAAGGVITGDSNVLQAADSVLPLVNAGTIGASGANGSAIYLQAGGAVSNASGGLISGVYDGVLISNAAGTVINQGSIGAAGNLGVELRAAGTVTNTAGGSISGGGNGGVAVSGGAGTVVNDGAITGTGAASVGVGLSAGGTVSNAASASIGGVRTGIQVGGAAGTVTNFGSIGGGSYYGVFLDAGGSLTNAASATITGHVGADVETVLGTVTNAGSITGVDTGVRLRPGGLVSNASGGVITGNEFGVFIYGGTLINQGSIAATGTDRAAVELSNGVAAVTNNAGGSITGGRGGIEGSGAFDTVVNRGFVQGTYGSGINLLAGGEVNNGHGGTIVGVTGIYVRDGVGVVDNAGHIIASGSNNTAIEMIQGGRVANQAAATISGPFDGIAIGGSVGSVMNAGSIIGTGDTGIVLNDGGTVSQTAGGVIAGGHYGVRIGGAVGGLVNAGSITAGTDAVLLGSGGNVSNAASGVIDGGYAGVLLGEAGTVINQGSIAATGNAGIDLRAGGAITNSATASISGLNNGVLITGDVGTLVNDGAVTGSGTTANGVNLGDGGAVTNASGASIFGGRMGIVVTGVGSVVNDGSIAGGSYYGVFLTTGGALTNTATATISGSEVAVVIVGGAGTLSNAGTITSSGNGIALSAGGLVSNASGGLITAGDFGVVINGGTLINAGSIASTSTLRAAVELNIGAGLVSNQSGGVISGGGAGIYATGTIDTVVNAGEVQGAAGDGIQLVSGGAVSNQTGGTIAGLPGGIYVRGDVGTVVNDGGISGTGAGSDGVDLAAGGMVTNHGTATISGSDTGVLVTGAVGTVVNAGNISGASNGGVVLAAGGTVTEALGGVITGGNYGVRVLAGPGTVVNAGTITATNAASHAISLAGGYANLLVDDPGAGFVGTVDGGGSLSTLELAVGIGTIVGLGGQFVNFGSLQFDTNADWFVEGSTAGLAGPITGFAGDDTIEVDGITVTGSSYAGGVLTLTDTTGTATLALVGNFSTGDFKVTNVAGGAEVSLACFRAGTLIRTKRGDVPVEHLAVGDEVETVLGARAAPIIWIGHRVVDCRRHPKPAQAWPVRISADAFGPGLPCRDLFLSPNHAVYVGEVLIPVQRLVNGTSITQVSIDTVSYYHIELEQHDVVLAEGMPVESYLDTGDRFNYANGGGAVRLFPDFTARVWEAMGCAPLIVTGPELEAARRLVNSRTAAVGSELSTKPGRRRSDATS